MPLPFEVQNYLDFITSNLDLAVRTISPHGNGKTLKTNRPKHGTYAYIWRMCRFHSGVDLKMPVTCFWYLSAQLEKDTGHRYGFSLLDAEQKEILAVLDRFVDRILDHMRISKYTAALGYKGLLY